MNVFFTLRFESIQAAQLGCQPDDLPLFRPLSSHTVEPFALHLDFSHEPSFFFAGTCLHQFIVFTLRVNLLWVSALASSLPHASKVETKNTGRPSIQLVPAINIVLPAHISSDLGLFHIIDSHFLLYLISD